MKTAGSGSEERLVRVLLVDDHRLVREGLRARLHPEAFVVVGEVSTGAEAIAAAQELEPDVVLLDINLADMSGAVVCAAILEQSPTTTVLIISAYADEHSVISVLDAGAHGYLLKDADLDVVASIRRALAGEVVLDSRITSIVVRNLGARGVDPCTRLTEQEVKILQLAAEGASNREIGSRLYLSRHTVKEYLSNAMRKLGVSSRVVAVLEAERRGLIARPALDGDDGGFPARDVSLLG